MIVCFSQGLGRGMTAFKMLSKPQRFATERAAATRQFECPESFMSLCPGVPLSFIKEAHRLYVSLKLIERDGPLVGASVRRHVRRWMARP
jgi:hypothetical protein